MDLIVIHLILVFYAYIIGSVPFGVIIGWLVKRVDIRDFGSGNIGFGNAERVLGPKWSKLVLILDILKATVAVYYIGIYQMNLNQWWICAMGLAAVLGHVKSIFSRFKGGKAVSTTCGVILAIKWDLALIGLGSYLIIKKITKKSALGSLSALLITLVMSIIYCIMGMLGPIHLGLFAVLGAIIILLHVDHIRNFVNEIKQKSKIRMESQNSFTFKP